MVLEKSWILNIPCSTRQDAQNARGNIIGHSGSQELQICGFSVEEDEIKTRIEGKQQNCNKKDQGRRKL